MYILMMKGIFNLDCIEYMESIKDLSIDLVICDPPYFRILEPI